METPVYEISSEGCLEVEDIPKATRPLPTLRQEAENLKAQGNDAFKKEAFALAYQLYSQAMEVQQDSHILYSNRAAASLKQQKYTEALVDAKKAVDLSPNFAKGHLRLATAYQGLGRLSEALACCEHVLELPSDGLTSGEINAAKKQRNEIRRILTHKYKGSSVPRGFLSNQTSTIYSDKDNVPEDSESKEELKWQRMLRHLKEGCVRSGINASGENVVLDDGVFSKLLNPAEFQRLVYPGISSDELILAPQNLRELLEDTWYEKELLELMPKIQAKAQSVLAGVKKRGETQGEVMDAYTELALIPQILQEAFGRELVAMVRRVNIRKHAQLAKEESLVADPTNECASWDQLPSSALSTLFSSGHETSFFQDEGLPGVAIVDSYMGEEWGDQLLDDVQRMETNGLLIEVEDALSKLPNLRGKEGDVDSFLASNKSARIKFVTKEECAEEYPALEELVDKLQALPFEINKKQPGRAKLCAPFTHSMAVNYLQHGEAQNWRLDCGTGDQDNGFRLSCIYFFNPIKASKDGNGKSVMNLLLAKEEAGKTNSVEVAADRLVLFKSQQVASEIPTVNEESGLYYLSFWIHGQCLE